MSAVLTVESVSKRYRIQRNRPITLKESIIRRLTGRYDRSNVFWALRDVTFSVEQGRALGIIGHNGAGKSTLLRLLCGLGRPTNGRIRHAGKVSARAGYPELDGYRNECEEYAYLADEIITTENFDRRALQTFLALWRTGHILGAARDHRAFLEKQPDA